MAKGFLSVISIHNDNGDVAILMVSNNIIQALAASLGVLAAVGGGVATLVLGPDVIPIVTATGAEATATGVGIGATLTAEAAATLWSVVQARISLVDLQNGVIWHSKGANSSLAQKSWALLFGTVLVLVVVVVSQGNGHSRMTPMTRSRANAAPIKNHIPFLPNGEDAAVWS
jgi:tetrahydromethanopterin S-methyltransferase subunit D